VLNLVMLPVLVHRYGGPTRQPRMAGA
jgi:hypothetical protein